MTEDLTKPLKSYSLVLMEMVQMYGPVSKRRLQELTGFSWGLISRLTNELAELNYIVSIGKTDTTVGRKAEEYDLNESDNYFVGVDFSGLGAVIAIVDMKGRIVERFKERWKKAEKEIVLAQFLERMDAVLDCYQDKNIMGIGLAVQGVVDVTKGVSEYIGGIEGWEDVPFKTMLEDRYEISTSVAHDPDCLIRCEMTQGVLRGSAAKDVVLVHFIQGTSVGMSAMVGGKTYMGCHEKANEIGHMILGKMQNGRYDFLDNHVSMMHMEEDYRNLSVKGERLTYEQIVAGAKEGNPHCKQIFERLYAYLGQSIAVVNSLLNPEILILHTIDCDGEEELYHTVDDFLRTVSYDKKVDFRLSKLGQDAKAVGAALTSMDDVLSIML